MFKSSLIPFFSLLLQNFSLTWQLTTEIYYSSRAFWDTYEWYTIYKVWKSSCNILEFKQNISSISTCFQKNIQKLTVLVHTKGAWVGEAQKHAYTQLQRIWWYPNKFLPYSSSWGVDNYWKNIGWPKDR